MRNIEIEKGFGATHEKPIGDTCDFIEAEIESGKLNVMCATFEKAGRFSMEWSWLWLTDRVLSSLR